MEKVSNIYYQVLWVEIFLDHKESIVCGVVYRQHNDPTKFQEYLNETLYNFSKRRKTVCILGDFNIDLLKYETCKYMQQGISKFLAYTYVYFPTITKPTRIYGDSATLIDLNIILLVAILFQI